LAVELCEAKVFLSECQADFCVLCVFLVRPPLFSFAWGTLLRQGWLDTEFGACVKLGDGFARSGIGDEH
jgi:hypothetical protein